MTATEHLWTDEQYQAMVDAGLTADVYMLGGRIYDKVTPSPKHIDWVHRIFWSAVDTFGRDRVMMETAVNVDGYPEPDITILNVDRVDLDGYATRHDIKSLIEVSFSTYVDDLNTKVPGYMRGRVESVYLVTEDEVRHIGISEHEPEGVRQVIADAIGELQD